MFYGYPYISLKSTAELATCKKKNEILLKTKEKKKHNAAHVVSARRSYSPTQNSPPYMQTKKRNSAENSIVTNE